jgi:hypothetical protein
LPGLNISAWEIFLAPVRSFGDNGAGWAELARAPAVRLQIRGFANDLNPSFLPMFALVRFGENPFDDRQISTEELGKYGTEHLGRMTADPISGQLDAEIAATATALQDFDVTISSETVKKGVQKARTAAKAAFREDLPNPISQIHGAVIGRFGQNSPRIAEFFPEGRTVFNQCQDNLLDNKLTALRDALQAEETATPGPFAAALALAVGLVTTWTGIYGAATTGRAQGAQSADVRRAAGLALRTQLYKNVLKIASIYAGQLTPDGQPLGAERIGHYCPQHLLENRMTPQPSPNPPQG